MKYIWLGSFLLIANSCTYDFPGVVEEEEILDIQVDLNSFSILGDMNSSGFMNGALYKGGQNFSYPSIFINKLEPIIDGKPLVQADLQSENGLNRELFQDSMQISGKYYLSFKDENRIYPSRHTFEGQDIIDWKGSLDSLQDISIPGLKVYELDNNSLKESNPYFDRIPNADKSPLDIILDSGSEVVLIDIGSEDLLGYALDGAAGREDPDMDEIQPNDLTPVNIFEQSINTAIQRILAQTDAHIFIANIANPLEAPYFKTLNWALEPEIYSVGYIGNLQSFYSSFAADVTAYNRGEDGNVPEEQRPLLDFDTTGYPLISPRFRARVIVDELLNEAILPDGTEIPKWRPMVEGELVLYKIEEQLVESSKLSGEIPLTDEMVLTLDEIAIIDERRAAFNKIIEDIADQENRISLINVDAAIDFVHKGEYSYENVLYTSEFERYGIYSADGYSLNPRGNAIIANELINAINRAFDSNLSLINPNDFRGTRFSFNEQPN